MSSETQTCETAAITNFEKERSVGQNPNAWLKITTRYSKFTRHLNLPLSQSQSRVPQSSCSEEESRICTAEPEICRRDCSQPLHCCLRQTREILVEDPCTCAPGEALSRHSPHVFSHEKESYSVRDSDSRKTAQAKQERAGGKKQF